MGTPTWSHDGVMAVAGPMKGKVKVTFSRGAHLPDPTRIFNNGLGGKEWRAIDILETDRIDEAAFTDLVRAAVQFNRSELAKKAVVRSKRPGRSIKPPRKRRSSG